MVGEGYGSLEVGKEECLHTGGGLSVPMRWSEGGDNEQRRGVNEGMADLGTTRESPCHLRGDFARGC